VQTFEKASIRGMEELWISFLWLGFSFPVAWISFLWIWKTFLPAPRVLRPRLAGSLLADSIEPRWWMLVYPVTDLD
jgi:hypothetical protein